MVATFVRLLAASLLALPAIVSAVPSPTTTALTNPLGLSLNDISYALEPPAPIHSPETNAQRLKRGLPPKPPVRRTNRALQPRASPPPLPVAPTGYIKVVSSSQTGYVSARANSFGEYGYTANLDEALKVTLLNTAGSPFDVVALNGIAEFPTLGFIKGFASTNSDLHTGSHNYAYLGGVTPTPPGSPALVLPNSFSSASGVPEGVESAVWSLGTDGQLKPSWVNTDGGKPPIWIMYVDGAAAYAISGDPPAFGNAFGDYAISTFWFESI
ncbi:hypothetical protein BXZ70DRAFT_909643 [Cristinia sonorae]|uniref:Uncharacterized protein n=1 Tax=Cristinia sonorae TaxID=1940300 RepID=A0A8K0UIN0_9AGAR|nr:hypothetical protein BXZ70DRAFT_909643 [Cristinia sonorae]